ncbi:MAG TPA: 3D domain-containing protein [Elusimicrobiota bacterium]|jgi:3D (Asp-Asp-Asp) domain-containing protein|nr:3D domain-containing protein [Elusimicrobiota bacterium]
MTASKRARVLALAAAVLAAGASRARAAEDEIQRRAVDLMKTVRPVSRWKKGEPIGRFLDTYYFNVLESDYPGPRTVTVKDGRGKPLASVTAGFWEHFSVEGTGRLLDGRELNTSEGGTVVVKAPMGEGTCRLEKWRSMAVDPRVIPLGTVVKIDETVGLKLPDGTVADGYWQAVDTGGEVRNAHVDLYVGDGEKNGRALEDAGIHLRPLTVRYVSTPRSTCAKP